MGASGSMRGGGGLRRRCRGDSPSTSRMPRSSSARAQLQRSRASLLLSALLSLSLMGDIAAIAVVLVWLQYGGA